MIFRALLKYRGGIIACTLALSHILGAAVSIAAQGGPALLPDDVTQKLVEKAIIARDPTADRLNRYLDETVELLNQTEAEDSDAEGDEPPFALGKTRRASILAKLNEFDSMREEVRERFATIHSNLLTYSMPDKVQAWDDLLAKVEERFDRITTALNALHSSSSRVKKNQALDNAKMIVRELYEQVGKQEIPDSMPVPTFRQDLPASPVPQPESDETPQYISQDQAPASNVYAFLGNTLLAPPATPPEAASCYYTDADLADDGQEIQKTEDIKALAQQLGYSPVKIYKYVYDNIKYEPYYGSLKGAQGTLIAGSGNATDQASLLIALLRTSNIPARYVKGKITIDDKLQSDDKALPAHLGRAPRWLGAKTYQAAVNILSFGNILAGIHMISNIVRGIYLLDHVWVEACVPYGHYRGARIDNAGTRWIPLDTSFKDISYQQGIATNVQFDYNSTNGYMSTLTDQLPHEKYAEQVETDIKSLNPNSANNTLPDVGYLGTQNPLKLDILPASLPYAVTQFSNWSNSRTPETAVIPDTHRYRLSVTVKNGATQLLSTNISYPNAALKRISLSYTPADPQSQNYWSTWGGEVPALPLGTVMLSPVIQLEGFPQGATTGSVPLGTDHTLIMKLDLGEVTRNDSWCMNDSGSPSKTVTLTIASPCVASQTAHGLADGTPVVFSTTGTLPTGVVPGTTYYGRVTGVAAPVNNFHLYDTLVHAMDTANTVGRVVTSGSQSGTQSMSSYDPDPNCLNKTVYTTIKAGNYHALQANAFQTSDRLLANRSANLISTVRANPVAPTPAQETAYDSTTGEFLHIVLLKYLRYVRDSSKFIGELQGFSALHGNDIGITSSNMKISYLFNIPYAVYPGGLLIDVKGAQSRIVKLDTAATTTSALLSESWPSFKLAAYTASAYEHYVWQENARLDAISTVRNCRQETKNHFENKEIRKGRIQT